MIPANPDFTDADEIRLVNNALAYCFEEARLATTGGSGMKINKYPRHISTNLRVLSRKDGDLMSYFDKINENKSNDTLLKQTLINNHTVAVNSGKISGQLPLKHIFGFC